MIFGKYVYYFNVYYIWTFFFFTIQFHMKYNECLFTMASSVCSSTAPSRSSSSTTDETDFDFIKPTPGKTVQKKASSVSSGGPKRTPSSAGEPIVLVDFCVVEFVFV